MSPAKDLGTKHTCWKCETKFYDLRKAVPLCPKCGADMRESPALKAPVKEPRKAAAPKAAKVVREPILDEGPEDEELVPSDEESDEEAPEEEEEEEEI